MQYHKTLNISTVFPKLMGIAAITLMAACSSTPDPQTEGERLLLAGNRSVERAEDSIKDAEKLIKEGKKSIRKGEKLIEEGEEDIAVGKQRLTTAREELFLAKRQQQAGEKLVKSEYLLQEGQRAYNQSRRLQEGGLLVE